MNAGWYPDPLGRAQLRYYDGTAWTRHVASFGQQSEEPSDAPLGLPPATRSEPPPPGSGRLLAAGVMSLISAAVTLLIGVALVVALADPSAFDNCDSSGSCNTLVIYNQGLVTVEAILILGLAVLLAIAGIGGCMRKHWGQITLVVVGLLCVANYFVPVVAQGYAWAAIPIVWFSIIAGLAASTDRSIFAKTER